MKMRHRWLAGLLLSTVFHSWTQASEPFSLKLDPAGITPTELPALQSFLREVETTLPEKLKAHLARTVTVHFKALDSSPALQLPQCIGDTPDPDAQNQVLAQVKRKFFQNPAEMNDLYLHRHLKSEIMRGRSGARTYSCGHKNTYQLAIASAVHEIGHIYDFADTKTPEEKRYLQLYCSQSPLNKSPSATPSPECQKLRNRLRVSNRSSFLDLMGWVETGLIFHTRGQGNTRTLRSPDPYEFKNWKEAFAVNLEYFTLDPEFACRRPAVHDYYVRHFGTNPHPERRCHLQSTITLSSSTVGSGQALTADIDPARVYEIHSLFAGKGPQLMSKWGHSLYRIVVCAPERKTVGPECLNDVAYHVAVSFRANVSDASISTWKGLTGQYSSLVFAQPFLGVLEEYNKSEFREVTSLPLRLSENEKAFFIHRLLEAIWEYGGRYKFITNNCATEALNFLKGSLGETRLSSRHPISPLGLHDTLQKLGIVDGSVLADRQKAVEKGYFYASKKPEVERAHQGLLANCGKNCQLGIPVNLDQYLGRTSAAARKQWYGMLLSNSGEVRQVLASRFFLLESYVQRRANQAYMNVLAKVIETQNFDGLPREAVASADEMKKALTRLRELQQLMLPISLKSQGYGIPITNPDSSSGGGETTTPPELLEESRRLTQQVIEWSKTAFAAWQGELDAIQKNRLFFLKEMRKPAPEGPRTLQ